MQYLGWSPDSAKKPQRLGSSHSRGSPGLSPLLTASAWPSAVCCGLSEVNQHMGAHVHSIRMLCFS